LNVAAKCIDFYTQYRNANAESGKEKVIDPRLVAIVDRMFQRCLDDGQYRQALGLALETRRMDIFEKAIKQSVRSIYLESNCRTAIFPFILSSYVILFFTLSG
jgi:hypothetical protein